MAFELPLVGLLIIQHRDDMIEVLESNRCVNHNSWHSLSSVLVAWISPSDFREREFVHAAQLLHGDLEGVFVGVMLDDVVVHVHQNPDIAQTGVLVSRLVYPHSKEPYLEVN